MDFYKYLNFIVFIFLVGGFFFLYTIIVFLSYKLRPYRKVRQRYLKEVEFWKPQKGFELIRKFLKDVD